MSYKIYIDKSELFEAQIQITGANVSKTRCRLIFETDEMNMFFNGILDNNKCSVKIPKMDSILDEGTTGKIKLEVIADDSYFEPWSSNFEVLRKTKVSVKEQTIDEIPSSKRTRIDEVRILSDVNDEDVINIKEVIREFAKNNVKQLSNTTIEKLKLSENDVNRINKALKKLVK